MSNQKPTYLKGNVRLQERDKNILEFIFRFRIATIDQIQKMFFKDSNSNACYQRLRKLETEKYLKIYDLRSLAKKIYQITAKGCAAIGVEDKELLKKGDSQRIYNSQVIHDLALTDIAIAFLTLPHKISYQSENEIRAMEDKDIYFIPDASMTVEESLGITLAVEYERTFKQASKYASKFSYMLEARNTYQRYLYVLNNLKKRSFFYKVVEESDYLMKENFARYLLFVERNDLINNPYDCKLYTYKGNSFSFRDLFKKMDQKHMSILRNIPLIIKKNKYSDDFLSD